MLVGAQKAREIKITPIKLRAQRELGCPPTLQWADK